VPSSANLLCPEDPLRVGLIANTRYPDLGQILSTAVRALQDRGWHLAADEDLLPLLPKGSEPLDPAHLDLLLTFGGDGTLLRGARRLAGRPVPVLGINFGRIGFLTAVSRDDVSKALDAFAAGRHVLSSRAMLRGQVEGGREGAPPEPVTALNDVVLHKGGVARVVRYNLTVDGELIGAVSADGLVVASPTGSTAYSLSAGGPVVAPTIDAMILTPIAPHSLSVRPIVVPGSSTVSVVPLEPRLDDLLVSFDGQQTSTLPPGAVLTVRIAAERVVLVRFPGFGFFARLREKLNWGDLSGRN
jgi:NAD+ kinase